MPRMSRRRFLAKSAATGAVAWATPVIVSLPGGRAWAHQYPKPKPKKRKPPKKSQPKKPKPPKKLS
jgi:hypothetical protein